MNALDTEDPKWKRKRPSRIYDYNYKVSEGYYLPQTEYMENRQYTRSAIPPEAQTYGERFSSRPWYGNTRGLPYREEEAALNQPLVNRRAVSASRASSITRERNTFAEDDPFAATLDFRRKRRLEKQLEEGVLIKNRPKRVNIEEILPPARKIDIKEELRKIDEMHKEVPSWIQRKRPSRKHEQHVGTENDIPSRKGVTRENYTSALPSSTASVRRSSLAESSSYDITTFTNHERTRHFSGSEDSYPVSLPPRPRSRNVSIGEEAAGLLLPSSARINSITDEKSYRISAKMLKDLRRAKESEELTDNIKKMIHKLRHYEIDDSELVEPRRFTRSNRSSSIGPIESSSSISRISHYGSTSRPGRSFVYGVGL